MSEWSPAPRKHLEELELGDEQVQRRRDRRNFLGGMIAGAAAMLGIREAINVITGPGSVERDYEDRAQALREEREQLRRLTLTAERHDLPVDVRRMIEQFNHKVSQHDGYLDASTGMSQEQRAAFRVAPLPLGEKSSEIIVR